jgi:glutamine kinase
MKKIKNDPFSKTKAETLIMLSELGYNVPSALYFAVHEWNANEDEIIDRITNKFGNELLAIRSSSLAEDTADSSMAGAFESLLNINIERKIIKEAVKFVVNSFDDNLNNQVLIQPMVKNVAMSGVVMTQVLDDGSPYHVINFDDKTGLTDTVTSGSSINKTVYIYNGVDKKDFDSPLLLSVLDLIHDLQDTFPDIPLDIEFAIDKDMIMHLLQVRKITTIKNWNNNVSQQVSNRMYFLKDYVKQLMQKRPNLFGEKTLLGFMPDWNPAEMIGVVPYPLAMSLYIELITKRVWSTAREKMGYRKMPNVELMVSLFGRVYIDVRNSINSFLPEGLESQVSEKLVNAYIERLDKNPHLHDKIEFEVVHTAYDFDFEKNFKERYPELLTKEEFLNYRGLLKNLTNNALDNGYNSSLNVAIRDIEKLKILQNKSNIFKENSFSIADNINTLVNECIDYGTLPFSIIARHGFIAENLLRSLINNNAISNERITKFKTSFNTISGEMTNDFEKVLSSEISKKEYLLKYGHLRPSSYDILSPTYSEREDLFNGTQRNSPKQFEKFSLSTKEKSEINILLYEHGLDRVSAEDIFIYAEKAIKGREYAKFIFTKHLSQIIENIAKWGAKEGFVREEMAMLTIRDVLSGLISPLTDDVKSFYQKKINKARNNFDVASSFKLSYLIRSIRDLHIVPMQRSSPNFIGNKRIEAEIIELNPYQEETPNLENKIVCIVGADPGYDWIFTRNIAGLITKFGGANSHMAIRCAEYDLPAAIGCGEQPFEKVLKAGKVLLDCQGKRLEPISI